MKSQVLFLADQGIIDTSLIGLDSTPVQANTSQNNPKSFLSNKFDPDNQPKADSDCKLGVHTVFLSVTECTFLADKGYDVKNIYNQVKHLYNGECIIPLNKRNAKNTQLLPIGTPVCEAGLSMNRDGKSHDKNRTRQKFCCPYKLTEIRPINHTKINNGKKHRGCTKHITLPDDLRLSINRDSKYFKNTYSLRTACERYNSRFKDTGQERMWVRNISLDVTIPDPVVRLKERYDDLKDLITDLRVDIAYLQGLCENYERILKEHGLL